MTIKDDEAPVTVAATDATAGEPGTGQGTGTFTFTRTAPTTAALTVNFTVSGTATAGSDYTALGTTVTFAAGSATATKTVSVIDDSLVESDETVVVTLATGTGYTVGSPPTATVTIKDDDGVVNLALASRGSSITGSNGTNWTKLIDGVTTGYTATNGYGYTIWMQRTATAVTLIISGLCMTLELLLWTDWVLPLQIEVSPVITRRGPRSWTGQRQRTSVVAGRTSALTRRSKRGICG